MEPQDGLADLLADFARTLATDLPVQGILDHLVLRTVDILPIDAAGVSLIPATIQPRLVAGSDEPATRYEHLQTELDEGPCLVVHDTMQAIAVPDLRLDPRFPVFTARALEEGLGAVFTFPLRQGAQCLGALDLYRSTPGPLTDSDMATAQTLADVTTAYLVSAQARAEKTELVTTLSHELRTPMTSISGFVELLVDEDASRLSPNQTGFLTAISRNSDRLLALADDLLTLTGLESTTGTHATGDVDVGRVVSDVQEAMRVQVEQRDLSVTFEVPPGPSLVRGDAQLLSSMVSNLVGNALKFTQDGGWVRCTLSTSAATVVLNVQDNGIGVPAPEQAKLFTRFFRSSDARERAIQGSGLGLTIVASVVRNHGGEISYAPGRPRGSTFTVILPLADDERVVPQLRPSG